MDICLDICIEKICQRLHWSCRNVFSSRPLKLLKSIEKIKPGMICYIKWQHLQYNRLIDARNETDITDFYNELSSLVWHISKHSVLINNKDMNRQKQK